MSNPSWVCIFQAILERKSKSRAQGTRADKLVKEAIGSLTGRQIDEAFQAGLILSPRGKPLSKGDRLTDGEMDLTKLREHLSVLHEPAALPEVNVLFESSDIVVVDKPAGIPCHPIGLFDRNTLTHWAMKQYPQVREEFKGYQPTLTPHRLDTNTSGVQIVALSQKAFKAWRERFARKEVEKRYLAWCWGSPKEREFEIHWSIGHCSGDERKMVCTAMGEPFRPPVQEAQTFVKVEKVLSENGACLLQIRCLTGVTHQIRVHLSSKGLPLVGDELYDPRWKERSSRPNHHMLRATELAVKDGPKFLADSKVFEDFV